MGRAMGLGAMVLVGAIGWRVAGSLGSDALGMAVGVLFGILAGIPTALLMLAANNRRHPETLPPPAPQVTIINHYHATPAQPQLAAPAPTAAEPGAGTALVQMPGYHAWWDADGANVHVVKVSTGQAWTVPVAVYQGMAANPPRRLLTDQGQGPTANLQ